MTLRLMLDLDGTLVHQTDQRLLRLGAILGVPGEQFLAQWRAFDEETNLCERLRIFGHAEPDSVLNEYVLSCRRLPPIINNRLAQLAKDAVASNIDVAIFSASHSRLINVDLGWLQVSIPAGRILGSDNHKPPKPQRGSLESALQTLGFPPVATTYVGDSDTDLRLARAAGVEFHAIQPWRDDDTASAALVSRLRARFGLPVR